jgi:polyisoprenyl-phosphate glycosyltransferase
MNIAFEKMFRYCKAVIKNHLYLIQKGRSTVKISFVIPVFNNGQTIRQSIDEIIMLTQSSLAMHQIELICVDDGSTDDSWDQIISANRENPERVIGVKLSKNFGQLAATLCGYEKTSGDAVVTISADLQDPISLVPDMVSQFESGSDVVIAHRAERHDGLGRKLSSGLAYNLAGRDNAGFPKGGFDYTLLSKKAVSILLKFEGRHRFLQSDVLYLGLKRSYIPYARMRAHGNKSGYTFSKRIKVFIDLLVDSSYSLIQGITKLGFLIGGAGILFAIYLTIIRFFSTNAIPGWTFIVVAILINSGLIIFILGLLAEYQWRIYDQLRSKPLYIIDNQTN